MAPTGRALLPLSERMRPVRLDDLVGNARARFDLRAWAEAWAGPRPPGRRAAVLSGPAGVGKTSAALALAHDFGWSVVEMNASDARNERAIAQVAGRASLARSLADGRGPHGTSRALILLDEADCLTGRLSETPRPRPEPPPLREFLRGRYGSIESLNAGWGLVPAGKPAAFSDWESVPKSPGNAGWARLPAARADLEEWRSSQGSADLSDRGGMAAIGRLVRTSLQPLVLTVNDEQPLTRYSPVFRTGVLRVHFLPLRDAEVRSRVDSVVRSERLRVSAAVIEAVVRRAHGDLRAALNDLDSVAAIEPGPEQLAVLGFRDRASDLAALVSESMTSARFYRSVEVQDRLDAPPDDLLPWVEENLPYFAPDGDHARAAFEVLAVADRFLMRARRWRVWSQWSYATELLTGGVGLALREHPTTARGDAAFPQFLFEMGRTRGARATREALVAKASARFHLSHRKARDALVPFLEGLFREAPRGGSGQAVRATLGEIVDELDLSPEEVGLLLREGPGSARVLELTAPREAPAEEPIPEPEQSSARRGRPGGARRQRQLSEFSP